MKISLNGLQSRLGTAKEGGKWENLHTHGNKKLIKIKHRYQKGGWGIRGAVSEACGTILVTKFRCLCVTQWGHTPERWSVERRSVNSGLPRPNPSTVGPSLLRPWCRDHSIATPLCAQPTRPACVRHQAGRQELRSGNTGFWPPHRSGADQWSQWQAEPMAPATSVSNPSNNHVNHLCLTTKVKVFTPSSTKYQRMMLLEQPGTSSDPASVRSCTFLLRMKQQRGRHEL